jgi:hypothetical protein
MKLQIPSTAAAGILLPKYEGGEIQFLSCNLKHPSP